MKLLLQLIVLVIVSFVGIAEATAGPCPSGQVWRERFEGDGVCVPPSERYRLENGQCRSGWVWRDSFPGDNVCVTPSQRAAAKAQGTKPVKKPAPKGCSPALYGSSSECPVTAHCDYDHCQRCNYWQGTSYGDGGPQSGCRDCAPQARCIGCFTDKECLLSGGAGKAGH
jgi:hypothetical protein